MLRIYQVDAFHHQVLHGNPAAIIPLDQWLDDERLQAIATENNLSETAFYLPAEGREQALPLRWFTPKGEVRLCGHATLATAHVLFTEIGYRGQEVRFSTQSGLLTVSRLPESGRYRMDFPADIPTETEAPISLAKALGLKPVAVYTGTDDLLVVLESEAAIRQLAPRFGKLAKIEKRGVIVTAPGEEVDFVSRCFYPRYGIPEDPVTGSAHTLLTPYWAKRLGKKELSAQQLSTRQGILHCTQQDDRVLLEGNAVTYLRGMIYV